MKKRLFAKIISVCLVLILSVGIIIPIATVNTKAKTQIYVNVPASTVSVSKIHAASTMVSAIGTTIKGIGAIKYASDKAETFDEFVSMALAYFSGNAQENEQISKLEDAMLEQFAMTQQTLATLSTQLDTLRTDLESMKTDIMIQNNYIYLKQRVDDFYTDFYGHYEELKASYNALVTMTNTGNYSEEEFIIRMDKLYATVLKLRGLDYHLVSSSDTSTSSIIDAYTEYVFLSEGIESVNDEKYPAALERCQNFALKLLSAYTFHKYCQAYVSSYHLNYINAGNPYYTVGRNPYDPSDTAKTVELPEGAQYILYRSDAVSKVEDSYSGASQVFASVASSLSGLYFRTSFVGYYEDGAEYYAPVTNEKLYAYNGASYRLYPLADDFEALFLNDFSFRLTSKDDPTLAINSSLATISSTGVLNINAPVGTTFVASYVYGANKLGPAGAIPVYSIEIEVVDRALAGGYGTAEAPYLIRTPDHYKAYLSDSKYHAAGVYTKMVADIDMTGAETSSISTFNGSFDGGNHTLSGLTSSSGGIVITNSGTIRNLTVTDYTVSGSGGGTTYAGVIADSNAGLIENCHVKDSSLYAYAHNFYTSQQFYIDIYSIVGGIVGNNTGTIKSSSVISTIAKAEVSTKEYLNAGGTFPEDEGTFNTYAYVGGIAGESTGTISDCYVKDSTVTSSTLAMYRKWNFAWSKNYDKVATHVRYGNIIGFDNGGTESNNLYLNVDNQNHTITRLAIEGTDPSFVTEDTSVGNNGTSTSAAAPTAYFTSISVSTKPYELKYSLGEVINTSGLEITDNKGNYLYGYTVASVILSDYKTYTVNVNYQDKSTSFKIVCECLHYDVTYEPTVLPTCQQAGTASAVFCNDCGRYVDTNETSYPKIACQDNDKDHNCDWCLTPLTVCKDDDKNHYCDVCSGSVSSCTDGNKDHKCDVCADVLSFHTDTNNDHVCEWCNAKASECEDLSRDHLCDLCNEKISEHTDSDDHKCDVCGTTLSSCGDNNKDHKCDVCKVTLSSCLDLIKDHLCDICGTLLSTHTDENKDHTCEWCGGKASDCQDFTKDHLCDICGTKTSDHSDIDDHKCDVCGITLSVCADNNNDHLCDICKKTLSFCADANKDHLCDVCSTKLTEHIDADNDHVCELCGGIASDHFDEGDHICDVCGKTVSGCSDKTADHRCDLCANILSECGDSNRNHFCDICNTRLSKHADADEDGECDLCFVDVENHEDEDNDGNCDICGDPWEPWQMPWWGILLIIFGIFAVLICGFLLIYWLSDYFY